MSGSPIGVCVWCDAHHRALAGLGIIYMTASDWNARLRSCPLALKEHTVMHARNTVAIAAAMMLSFLSNTGDPAYSREQTLRDNLAGTWILDNLQAVTWDEDDRNPFGSAPKG